MTQKQTLKRTIVFEECFTCGMPIAMTEDHLRQYNEEGMSISCVLGHGTVRRKSDNQKLRERLNEAQDEVTRLQTAIRNEREEARAQRYAAAKPLAQEQNKRKRLERRIHNGVCPHCRRSFQNVQRHMARQHPEAVAP